MKKYWILLLAAVAALVSCAKETPVSVIGTPGEAVPVTFNLTASHPDETKAVKTGWESGDAIFVFFNNVAAPKYLKMSYDGTWTSTEMNGGTATPGCLGLTNGNTGTMTAVFLPFGSDATVSASGTDFVFSATDYTYYLTASLPYTVSNNTVSGEFAMTLPDGFVQFFIVDSSAADGGCTLETDAVIPTRVASVRSDGTVVEAAQPVGTDMVGYSYGSGTDKGYLFSGKINGSYPGGNSYYFVKTFGKVRKDYFVSEKTLTSKKSVKLPANNDAKWQAVGSDKTVTFGEDKWSTCNVGAGTPEIVGDGYNYSGVSSLSVSGYKVPSATDYNTLIANAATRAWLSVKGQRGMVFANAA